MYARRVTTYNRRRRVPFSRVVRRPRLPYRRRVLTVRAPIRRRRIVRRR